MMPKILFSGYLCTFLAFSDFLRVCASECMPTVIASRRNLFIPEGGSVSLWCDILHCEKKWSGGWQIKQGHVRFLTLTQHVHLSNQTITLNTTRLFLNIHNLNQSDSGSYQCSINWENHSSLGHVTTVNVTAVPEITTTGRTLSHRLLVCAVACLCFPLTLAFACCFSSERQPAPPIPPPRTRNHSTARVNPKADVVYAVMSLDHPRQQNPPQSRMAATPVVYSTLYFSKV